MAVASGTASERKTQIRQQQEDNKVKSPSNKQVKMKSPGGKSSPAKRNNSPGIRVIGGRIYDSQEGKTCHQCRQKTRDFSAACMNQKKGKPCSIRFCHKCLLNRYGEKAEVVAQLGDWNCPKCRGICNCSFCMKRRGLQPTGQLVQAAKASGFSSVSEMLQMAEKSTGTSPDEMLVMENETSHNLGVKHEKENLCDKVKDVNLQAELLLPVGTKKNYKKSGIKEVNKTCSVGANDFIQDKVSTRRKSSENMKVEVLKEVSDSNVMKLELEKRMTTMKMQDDGGLNDCNVGVMKQKKTKRKVHNKMHDGGMEKKTSVFIEERKSKKPKPGGITVLNKQESGVSVLDGVKAKICGDQKGAKNHKRKLVKEDWAIVAGIEKENSCEPEVPLPPRTELTNVAGIEIPPEDVGNALQFLEFCAVFGKAIDLRKGQAESVLKDIVQGRTVRQGKFSSSVQFLIQLLFIIQEHREGSSNLSLANGNDSWIHALKDCISDSHDVAKMMDLDLLHLGADLYVSLSTSKKLRLLNFLCDEVLGTGKVRDWIEEQNAKLAEKAKEVKTKVFAAKDKEKRLKQKMQDDIAKAILAKNGTLSISEHQAIISHIKHEAAQAHAEVLESKGLLSKNNQISDAVRIEPIFLDTKDGHAYRRLKHCSDKSGIFLQDMGSGDALVLDEKWFAFDIEQIDSIEKHISFLRRKKLRGQCFPVTLHPGLPGVSSPGISI